jgi:PAS domain S-box-containing protein
MIYNSTHEDLQQRITELELETERLRQVEAALIESEHLSKQYLDLPGVLYLALDKDGNITLVNENGLEILGYRQEELLGKNWFKTCLPHKLQREVLDIYHQLMRGEIEPAACYENSILRKDGSERVIAWNNTVLQNRSGEIVGTLSSGEDITERKQMEEELKENEEKFRKIFNNEIDAISIFNIETRKLIDVNDAFLNLYGYTREEVLKLTVDDISAEPDSSKKAIKKSAVEGDTLILKRLHKKKDGSEITVELSAGPFTWKGEKVMFAVVRDITFRVNTIAALFESENKYKTLFETANDAIFILDMKGNFLDVNSTAHERLGYTKEEMLAMHITQLDPPEFAVLVPERLEQIQEHGMAVFESAHLRKDGSIMSVEVNSRIITLKGEEVFFSVIRDISLRKQLEEELLKVEKLEATGILAGGIAHDFNNILTGILGNVSLAKHQTKPSDSVFDKLVKAEKAALRAQDLTQQLLTFSSGGAPIKQATSIVELIKESSSFVLSGSNVQCQYFFPETLWTVDVDQGQLSQVIQNLIINATHAMPSGGVITICAENVNNTKKAVSSITQEKHVKLEVTDRGIGIPKNYLPKIFDPYFTTKQSGSGLGLASCYSIIKNHNGQIVVNSEVGVGTTFTIYLPVSKKTLLRKTEKQQTIYPGKGKILIMDDEEIIREFAGESLKDAGYEVEVVCDGREAVDCYQKAKEAKQPFAAVILDLTVPGGMGGKETLEKLLAVDPEVKAIVSSGYSKDPVMANFTQYGFMGIVPKPYRIEELSKALSEILN